MKVAYLVNQYPKTSHTFIRREIEALERLGLVVERFALRGWDAEVQDPVDVRERERTRYALRHGVASLLLATLMAAIRHPLRFWRALQLALHLGSASARPIAYHLAYLTEACWLLPHLRSSAVEHIHAHFGTNSTDVALLAHVLCSIPFSFTVHGPEEFDSPRALGLATKAHSARFVVVVSSYGRSQVWRWLPATQWDKVQVVHCGLSPDFRDAGLQPPANVQRVICVGRLCEQKAQLLLVQAMARYRQLYQRTFELVLAGDGEMRQEVQALVDRLELGPWVRITGWIGGAAIAEELRQARALVLPSFAEGLPVVLMEAMSLGRPVVSTYVAGIPELVRDGVEGWLVPAGSIEALAHALHSCLSASPDELALLGAAARARALERHDVDREAVKLAQLMFPRWATAAGA